MMQFQHLTSEDGISQSEVYCFLEDAQGFMWFGTVDGLNRYDGYQVSIFKTNKDDINSLSNNTIRGLVEDHDNRIWIGTDGGLCVYDTKAEKMHQMHIQGLDENLPRINSVLIKDDHLYLCTVTGVIRINISSDNLDQISLSAALLPLSHSVDSYQPVASTLSDEGDIWVTTPSQLYKIISESTDNSSLQLEIDLTSQTPDIRNIDIDQSGRLWIVSYTGGFICYDPKTKHTRHFHSQTHKGIISDKTSSVIIDKQGNLWAGTLDNGLIYLDKKMMDSDYPSFQSITHSPLLKRGLNSNLIYSLYESSSNLIWIGTIGSGINVHNPERKPFEYFSLLHASDLSSSSTNFIRAVYADEQNGIWIGTHNNGLYHLPRNGDHKIRKIGFSTESVFHIAKAGQGLLTICTEKGVSLVKLVNNELQIKSQHLIGPSFYSIKATEESSWIATLEGVKLVSNKSGRLEILHELNTTTQPALSTDNSRVLIHDSQKNQLFVGTEGGGLNVIQLDSFNTPIENTIYKSGKNQGSLSNNYIRTIIQTGPSEYWIGTYEGLNKMYTGSSSSKLKFSSYTREDGLPNSTIQSIVEDQQRNLWVGTNQGLCRLNPDIESIALYTINDGIQSNEFSEHTIYKTNDGEIIIGGINGINTFFPDQIKPSNQQPKTTITNFYLFNKNVDVNNGFEGDEVSPLDKSLSVTDSIILKPQQNSIAFEFSSLTYNAPEKVKYSYMLKGFDKDWNFTDAKSRKANYTNLDFGTYEFAVKSTNNDGIWEDSVKSVYILIKTPWHRTTLAYILYSLLALGGLFFFTNYSILRHTTKEKILLENQHNKKLLELDELRTQFFINISHDLRTPLTLISSPLDAIAKYADLKVETKSYLHLVQRNVKKLADMTEQLLDFTKVEKNILLPKLKNRDIISFIKLESQLFSTAFEEKGVALIFTSFSDELLISFDDDMISKVIFNILSNSLKHTESGTVTIRCSLDESSATTFMNGQNTEYLRIDIEDSGSGIDKDDIDHIFERFYQGKKKFSKGYGIGLSHTKDLIEAHDGKIIASSTKGKGTCMTLFLPIKVVKKSIDNIPSSLPREASSSNAIINSHSEISSQSKTDHSRSTILVVEDNYDLRKFISEELNREYNVLEAPNGDEGIKIAGKHHPHLIISDVMMPGKDGIEFCKEIKSDIQTSHIPVILLTAKVDKESKYKGLEIGADDYIAKPFELDLLLLRIKNLIENRRRLRNIFQQNQTFEPKKVTVTSIDERFLTDLMEEIEKGIPEADFTITALEQKLGMSHSSFYNKIKSLTGQSAKELIHSSRMKRAKQLLEDADKIRVSEVAYLVGYTDPKYFSKRFKEHFGSSPKGFINSRNI